MSPAFSRYIEARWGTPLPGRRRCSASSSTEIVASPIVYKKLVGMQMLLEGLAMGAFASIHAHTRDPLLKRLVQLVMTDEAFHHKFGKIWADRTIPRLSREEHERVEDWAARSLRDAALQPVEHRAARLHLRGFGLDVKVLRELVREAFSGGAQEARCARAPTSSACW